MNLLLDTHILLWALAKPKQLPHQAVEAIYQADTIFFSPVNICLLYTSPSPRDRQKSRMPSSA